MSAAQSGPRARPKEATVASYRIEFSVQRQSRDGDDFEEIGFGSSLSHCDLRQCSLDVDAAIQNRAWETTAGMPDPLTEGGDRG